MQKLLAAFSMNELRTAHQVLYISPDEVARNGALLENNFGQRFSWAPLCNLFWHGPPRLPTRHIRRAAIRRLFQQPN
jgi:hypothetical protein